MWKLWIRRATVVLVSALLIGAAPLTLDASSAVAATCAQPGTKIKQVPWPQQMLEPRRVWPITQGRGVTVAILDSGVDAHHPQLRGSVSPGFDAVAGTGPANTDCTGSGTQVAGIIAGHPIEGTGFAGVAPAVTIVPVRVLSDPAQTGDEGVRSDVMARAITWATEADVDVIAVTAVTYRDDALLRAAVAAAVAKDIVVIAAAGDRGDNGAPPFPAAYPGVVGVGAIDRQVHRWSSSPTGSFVDLVAPGVRVVSTQRGGGLVVASGTGLAAAFVAGSAALVRSDTPARDATAAIRQLLGTATPAPGGQAEYGRGGVNPVGAVVDAVVTGAPEPPDPVAVAPTPGRVSAWRARPALIGAGVAVLLACALIALSRTVAAGNRRRWRPTLSPKPEQRNEPAEPRPPVMLFD